jgi:dCTP deaminase
MTAGILVHQHIADLVRRGAIRSNPAIAPAQIQPASLDLRLATVGYRVRSGFLPERQTVAELLEEMTLYRFDLTDGAVLERGHCYVFPLLEQLVEPLPYQIRANPKSSTGRLDLFTRLLANHSGRFETAPPGYVGPLYLEVVPRSFPVRVRTGLSLNQIRFVAGDPVLDDDELRAEYARAPLLFRDDGTPLPIEAVRFDGGLCMGIALAPDRDLRGPVGYEARGYTDVVDLGRIDHYDRREFFHGIEPPRRGRMIVEPEAFYIFASKERVRVPRHLAAEMGAYDVGIGELRTNYAGFFDNGFGGPQGTRAVLEVRPHDVPFLVEDGQVFFKLQFFRSLADPAIAYGDHGLGSHYQGQALKLSKHFRSEPEPEGRR